MSGDDGSLQLLLVRTTAAASEALEALLADKGALGTAIERRRGARLVRLQAYFPADVPVPLDWIREKIAELHSYGIPVGPGEVRLLPVRREDWAESWKRHFTVQRVTPRLIVAPGWESIDLPEGCDLIRLDPGMAFGLGDHPTTRGCLVMMERMARSVGQNRPTLAHSTADVGCGTGILAIRAAQLGFGCVEAFDTEAEAVQAGRSNADRNGVADKITFREGTIPPRGSGPYQWILANLFLTVLESLLPRMARALDEGGEILAAGILLDQEDRFRCAAERRGLTIIDRICETAQPGGRRWPVLRLRRGLGGGRPRG